MFLVTPFWKALSIKIKIVHSRTKWIIYLFSICHIWMSINTLIKFAVKIFTLYVIIQYYIIAIIFILLCKLPLIGSARRVHHLILIFDISSWFKNESRFLFFFPIITYLVKLYSLRTSNHTCWNSKGVSSYYVAGILLFIGKMSKLLSIEIR